MGVWDRQCCGWVVGVGGWRVERGNVCGDAMYVHKLGLFMVETSVQGKSIALSESLTTHSHSMPTSSYTHAIIRPSRTRHLTNKLSVPKK
jgi:hypothetical protein